MVAAAADASTVTPSPAPIRSRSACATAEPRHFARAYDGDPGPANTQSAVRNEGGQRSPACSGWSVPGATATSRPTLRAKYACARAETSAQFSWKAYGVSSSTAFGRWLPSRATSSLWMVTIVGLVSPEPMMASMRQTLLRVRSAAAPTMGARLPASAPVPTVGAQSLPWAPGRLTWTDQPAGEGGSPHLLRVEVALTERTTDGMRLRRSFADLVLARRAAMAIGRTRTAAMRRSSRPHSVQAPARVTGACE